MNYIPSLYQTNELEKLDGSTRKTITRTRTLSLPTASELNVKWSGTAKPFSTDDKKITLLKLEGGNNDKWYHSYGFVSAPIFSITAINGSNKKTINGLNYIRTDSAGELAITGQRIYDLFINIGLNTLKTTDYSVRVELVSTNFFGEKLTGQIIKLVNFHENFVIDPTRVYVGTKGVSNG